MTDDPRVEAARHAFVGRVMRQCEETDDGQYDPDVAWVEAIAAADKAAWRPISEAPKDGTVLLLINPSEGICTGQWDRFGVDFWVATNGSFEELDFSPTHFMPLPAPPSDD